MSDERWVVVTGSPLYEVSSHGRVRKTMTKRVLKAQLNTCGYPSLRLGRRKPVRVHRVVAEMFCPRPADAAATIVNHKDGDRTNNRADNLEWVTVGGNVTHAVYAGRNVRSLTMGQVDRIRELYTIGGHSQEELAERFGISRSYVSNIVTGCVWRRLKPVPRMGALSCVDGEEEWRPCFGFPSYEASSKGRLRRVESGKVLAPIRLQSGYVQYRPRKDGKTCQEYAHRLVLLTFVGKPPADMRCPNGNHINNQRDDNRLCNLEWTEHRHNLRHRYNYPEISDGVSRVQVPGILPAPERSLRALPVEDARFARCGENIHFCK